jgi:ribonucleotide reductase beta subunit family protein with ferritin-like domain
VETCVDEEKAWANYLFKDGAIIGLNEELLHQYVEFIANRRLKALGYKMI